MAPACIGGGSLTVLVRIAALTLVPSGELQSWIASQFRSLPLRKSLIAVLALVPLLEACGGSGERSTQPPSTDAVVTVVGSGGGRVVTPSGFAGVDIPAGALGQNVQVTITRLADPTTAGAGPLPTTLKQYPLYYEYKTEPAVAQFGDFIRVGICQVSDASSPFHPPPGILDRLRLAHTDPVNPQTVEILERVDVDDFLQCADAHVDSRRGAVGRLVARAARLFPQPTPLYAAHGGLGGKVKSFSPFGAVDPGNLGVWNTMAPMPTARYSHAVGVVNGILYAIGGSGASCCLATNEAYDPATNTWSTKAPHPTTPNFVRVGVVNGVLYAVGAQGASGVNNTLYAYDAVSNTWAAKAPRQQPGFGFGVGVVNGILYAVGGGGGATVEAYDPTTDAWTTKAPMLTGRTGLAVGVVNGILYAVGGEGPSSTTPTEAYDPLTNSWTTKAPVPTPTNLLTVGAVNGVLYAVFGNEVFAYDVGANTWTKKAPMPTRRVGAAGGVVNGILYVLGGFSDALSTPLATNEAFTP